LTEKQAELKNEQTKQQAIINAAKAEIITRNSFVNRKQDAYNAAQKAHAAAITDEEKAATEIQLQKAYQDLQKEKGIRDAAVLSQNKIISTAQGWINRKQAIVNDAQSKANAANNWLAQKQAELKKEEDKQQPIIDKAKKDIEVAAANVALANKAYKAALSWMKGFNQGVQDFKSGYAFRPGTAYGQDYINGYKTGYDLASQCANNETDINNQPSSIVNSVTNNSSSQPSTNTVTRPQTTENKKEDLVHNTLPQTGDAINITSVLAGVVAILGSLFGLSSMRGRGNNK